jgi:hypothetical protein
VNLIPEGVLVEAARGRSQLKFDCELHHPVPKLSSGGHRDATSGTHPPQHVITGLADLHRDVDYGSHRLPVCRHRIAPPNAISLESNQLLHDHSLAERTPNTYVSISPTAPNA